MSYFNQEKVKKKKDTNCPPASICFGGILQQWICGFFVFFGGLHFFSLQIGFPNPSDKWRKALPQARGGQVGIILQQVFQQPVMKKKQEIWLVVLTHLKNISQNGNLPQIGVKIKKIKTTT